MLNALYMWIGFLIQVTVGGPAEQAGLRVGDKVLSVNDNSLVDVEHNEAVSNKYLRILTYPNSSKWTIVT